MSKFIYFQDFHIKGNNSINRKGNYFQDCFTKFDEILALAKEYDVKAILDGGDLLHSPEPSYRVLDELADRVEKTGIPLYSLFGNHAQRYHSNEHSKYTGLAHLQKRSDLFKYFDRLTDDFKTYNIRGIDYNHNVEESIKEDGIIFDKKFEGCWKVAVVHAFVCPKQFPYASHVVCDDITTNADLVLVAHYHTPWEKKVGNTQYLDIGCLGRNSITEAKVEPACVLLDTEKRSYEIIKLKSAKKGEDVFDFSNVKKEDLENEDISELVKAIESTDFQSMRIENIIQKIADEKECSKESVELVFNKIKEVDNGRLQKTIK